MWWEVLVAVLTLLRRLGGNREPLQACPGAVEHGVLLELLETGVGEGQPPQAALAGLCTPEAQSGIQDISRGGPALRGRSPWMVEAHVVPACLGRKLSLLTEEDHKKHCKMFPVNTLSSLYKGKEIS